MNGHEDIKRAAIQRKNELEHFGFPGTFQIDPDAFLSILAELEVSNNVGRALGDTICSVCDSRDALVRVNKQLKTEIEALHREREGKVLCDLELFETLRDSANTEADEHRQCMPTYHPLRQANLDSVVRKCDDLLAAMDKGEQP